MSNDSKLKTLDRAWPVIGLLAAGAMLWNGDAIAEAGDPQKLVMIVAGLPVLFGTLMRRLKHEAEIGGIELPSWIHRLAGPVTTAGATALALNTLGLEIGAGDFGWWLLAAASVLGLGFQVWKVVGEDVLGFEFQLPAKMRKRKRHQLPLPIAVALLVLLSSCASLSEYKKPPVPSAPAYSAEIDMGVVSADISGSMTWGDVVATASSEFNADIEAKTVGAGVRAEFTIQGIEAWVEVTGEKANGVSTHRVCFQVPMIMLVPLCQQDVSTGLPDVLPTPGAAVPTETDEAEAGVEDAP